MQINLLGKNMELSAEIKDYALKKITNLEKILSGIEEKGGEVNVNFEISKSTNHHKAGDVFHADCLVKISGKKFYGSADMEDMHQAIDAVKEVLFKEISKDKNRRQTLFKRGAASIKRMMKGLSGRNPFTSKH